MNDGTMLRAGTSKPGVLTSVVGRVVALVLALGVGVTGCGDVCEDAAQICADERRVAALEEDGEGAAAVCETTLEKHAQCIVDADSCAPDVVADCWESADGDSD